MVEVARVADILLEITARRRQRLAADPRFRGAPPSLAEVGPADAGSSSFLGALAAPGPSIIAEVKMGSPSLGDLRDEIDAEAQATAYAAAGAAALSVVVEPDRFHGSYELLGRCVAASGLPTLAKDFVVDPLQLDLARQAGAAAVLLIAALYEPEELAGYTALARRLGLVPLVEVHEESDLDRLAEAGRSMRRAWGETPPWELVGVNNRDLRTFEVDLSHAERLASRLPAGAVKVAESGITHSDEIARLAAAGFDAFLIGESLLLADDPAERLRQLGAVGEDASERRG